MKIKWLTEKQVQRAAKRGRKAALLCSIKHWEQLSSANTEQIKALFNSYYLTCTFCALCTRYNFTGRTRNACGNCKLFCLGKLPDFGGAWYKASDAFDSYETFRICRAWTRWKRASKALLRRIIKLYESEYGEYTNE